MQKSINLKDFGSFLKDYQKSVQDFGTKSIAETEKVLETVANDVADELQNAYSSFEGRRSQQLKYNFVAQKIDKGTWQIGNADHRGYITNFWEQGFQHRGGGFIINKGKAKGTYKMYRNQTDLASKKIMQKIALVNVKLMKEIGG